MMIIVKIGVTLITVALICLLWDVVSNIIGTVILNRKYGMYDSGDIPLIIFYTLIATGFTLLVVYGLSVLYIGG